MPIPLKNVVRWQPVSKKLRRKIGRLVRRGKIRPERFRMYSFANGIIFLASTHNTIVVAYSQKRR